MRLWALVACALLLGAAAPPQPQPQPAKHGDAAEQKASAAADLATPVPSMKVEEAAEYKRPCPNPKSIAEDELCAQWQAAGAAANSVRLARYQTALGILGFAGLIATLIYTARGTQAAIDAVEAQIHADRPLMQIKTVKVRRTNIAPADDPNTQLDVSWFLHNHGATGCWTEVVNIMYSGASPPEHRRNLTQSLKIISFVAPGEGVGTGASYLRATFPADDFEVIRQTKRLYVHGYSIYRDAGGRRWRTGFAGWITLGDDLSGKEFSFYPSETHWSDVRLKSAKPIKAKQGDQ